MTVNTQLLEQVMTHIEDHPEQHDQSVWVDECGTAACFAGWACLLSGWQVGPRWDFNGPLISPDTLIEKDTPEAAVDLLGIDIYDADRLFDARNTLPMLALMVKDLMNGEELRDWKCYNAEAAA
jgi:hypothetical protein